MEVKVTCPKCGESFSQPPARVVRKVRCRSCSKEFVPVREGVPCPECSTVLILPEGQSRRTVKCLNCSFAFREPKRWQKRRYQVLLAFAAVILVLVIFMLCRWRSNVALAREIRTEFKAWLETLPKVPDSENGMLVILEGHDALPDELPGRFSEDDFSLENESDAALVRECLSSNEEALQKIREGLQCKKFLLPVDYSKISSESGEFSVPSVHNLMHAAQLFALRGQIGESEGRKAEALREYLNILRLGWTLSTDRSFMSAMIEVVIHRTGLRPLTKTISETEVEEEDLKDTLETLVGLQKKGGKYFSIKDAEYYIEVLPIADIIEGKNGNFRNKAREHSLWLYIRLSPWLYDYQADADVCRDIREIHRGVDPAEYWSVPPEAKNWDALVEKMGHRLKEMSLFAGVILMNTSKAVIIMAEDETLWRGAVAMAGIRLFEARNGRLPKNLAELGELVPKELLTDPFSGNNLVYRLAGDDFFLYSVGLDGVDGNPTDAPPYFEEDKSLSDMPDIIFHAPRQNK